MVILASPKTLGHSPKARLVVTMIEVRSSDEVEQELAAGLSERHCRQQRFSRSASPYRIKQPP